MHTHAPHAGANISVVLFGVLLGGFALGTAIPLLADAGEGLLAFGRVQMLLKRESSISLDDGGFGVKNCIAALDCISLAFAELLHGVGTCTC
jgi:hypothetical protein